MAAQAAHATTPDLGAAANFSVLAGTALSCTRSSVTGLVGVADSSIVPTLVAPKCDFQVQVAPGAYANFLTAYGNIADGLFPCQILSGTLAGRTLGPGTYCFTAAATLTGTLTLTGGGPWIFEIGTGGGAFTATNFTVVSDNPCNVFWWVNQDVTLSTSTFQGTILGGGDITTTGTSLEGRALATGAVTMTDSNIIGCTGGNGNGNGKQPCNQGVGNGAEVCDPGNSNQGDPSRSNDELGGTPGNPGRKGGNSSADASANANGNANSNAKSNK
jgi:Ice-binding-like